MGFTRDAVITDEGLNLLGKLQAGDKLEITRAVLGEGELGSQRPGALTEVLVPVMPIRVAEVSQPLNGRVTIRFDATRAEDIPRDFRLREIGVYAKDIATGQEILYIYNNAGDTADYVHQGGAGIKTFRLPVKFGNAAGIVIEIDPSVAYALAEGTVVDGAAPTGDAGNLWNVTGWLGYMIKAITGKANWRTLPAITLEAAKAAIDVLYGFMNRAAGFATAAQGTASDTHIANKANPHGVTAAQAGAATAAQGTASDAHIANKTNPHGVTAVQAGAAPTSHAAAAATYGQASATNYGHAKASGSTPAPLGTAAVGADDGTYARGSHVHAMPTPAQVGAATAEQGAKADTALQEYDNGGGLYVYSSASATRENIGTQDRIATVFGKLMKWYIDFKPIVFSGSWNDLEDKPVNFSPSAHNHNAAEINAGTMPVVRGGTGASDAAAARSNLGVPSLAGSNSFAGSNTFAVSPAAKSDNYPGFKIQNAAGEERALLYLASSTGAATTVCLRVYRADQSYLLYRFPIDSDTANVEYTVVSSRTQRSGRTNFTVPALAAGATATIPIPFGYTFPSAPVVAFAIEDAFGLTWTMNAGPTTTGFVLFVKNNTGAATTLGSGKYVDWIATV